MGDSETIKNKINDSNKGVDTNNLSLCEYFDFIIRLRHDLLHYCVLKCLGRIWEQESTVNDYLQLKDNNSLLLKTPDIIHCFSNVVYLIDVSVSRDLAVSEHRKLEKYTPVCNYLFRTHDLNTKFIHINVKSSYGNVLKEINKLNDIKKIDFEIFFFNQCNSIIEEKIKWVDMNVDREYFSSHVEIYKSIENRGDIGLSPDLEIQSEHFINFNSKFDLEENISKNLENFTEDTISDYLKNILESKNNIFKTYKDSKCKPKHFHMAYEEINSQNEFRKKLENPKPTHHIIVPKYENVSDFRRIIGEKSEQKMLKNFFKKISEVDTNESYFNFVKEFSISYLKLFDKLNPNKEYNEKVFEDGHYSTDIYDDLSDDYTKLLNYKLILDCHLRGLKIKKEIKHKYNITTVNYSLKIDLIKNEYEIIKGKYKYNTFENETSYKDFLIKNDFLVDDKKWLNDLAIKRKCFRINFDDKDSSFSERWKKTGIGHVKNLPDEKKQDIDQTIEFKNTIHVDKMIEHMIDQTEDIEYKYDQYLGCLNRSDAEESVAFKKEHLDHYMIKYNFLKKQHAFDYLHKSKYICDQLLHFSLLNLKPSTFCVFNAGIPNCVYIVAGCYNKLFSENGKPFMFCCVTRDPDYYSPFFGKIKKMKIDDENWLCVSNWRRLPTFKLTHIKDSFFSVLSSTMNSFITTPYNYDMIENKKINKIFAIRTIISLCTNQRISEILMDNRYAYVSSYSEFTNISKLLIDKFGPPYRCSLECWLVNRILTRLPEINDKSRKGGIVLKEAKFEHGNRLFNSVGGKFNAPSLWFDYEMNSIVELLDEAFIYVHTLKEPSSTYSEYVNAMKTIVDFQSQFDKLSKERQQGIFKTFEDVDNFLLDNTKIGCFSNCIYFSMKNIIGKDKPFFKKIIDNINNESLSEVVSTKAVINDIERQLEPVENITKKETKKQIEKISQYNPDINKDDIKKYVLLSESKYYQKYKPRQRVFETVLSCLEDNQNMEKTIHLAEYFINKEKGKMVADICIKSQYGSKREFYVINMGAKALARCTENFFKMLCENNPNEAISIPGDKKMISMQKMLDRVYHVKNANPRSKLMYVNGDCTKWSAAETMASFVSMTLAFKEHLPLNMYNLLLSTFNTWSRKEIQVPLPIINNVIKPTHDYSGKFQFLNGLIENNGRISSTQNFLQGMFNYASSYKAVACANYTYYLWKKMYKDSNLYIEHMEHSDDYVLIVIYNNPEDFIKFRVLHKIMMRFHGYSDSERKTNCQPYLMEFVSLISFNGVMLYPHIKKSKEINTNLPCVGYKGDIESAHSRMKECMRVGCNQTFLYFFQRLHNLCVAEAYSLLPGMINNTRTFYDMLETPIELFGLPDTLPLFSLYCKGNGNNYRLYHYSNQRNQNYIIKLYKLANKYNSEEKFMSEDVDFAYSLFNGKFMYESDNKNLAKLRTKLNWDYDSLTNFWEKHMSYRLVKPKNRTHLIDWLKSMFYNRTFVEAYTKSSRTKMTMRLSHFSRNKVIKVFVEPNSEQDLETKVYTILKYQDFVESEMVNMTTETTLDDRIQIQKIITKCDPTYSGIYTVLKNIKIKGFEKCKKDIKQIAIKTPIKIGSYEITNSPETIIQYLFNYDDFILDKKKYVSTISIEKDIDIVKERLGGFDPKNINNPMHVLSIYNDLCIMKERQIVTMGYDKWAFTLYDQIKDVITNNFYPHLKCHCEIHGVIHVIDPYTNQTLYARGHKTSYSFHQQCLENMCLIYVYLRLKEERENSYVRSVFSQIMFEDKLLDIKMKATEILETLTIDNLETFKFDLNTKKIASYLKSELYGENEMLNNMVKGIYSYTYRYLTEGKESLGKYTGYTSGTFTHLKKSYKFVTIDNDNTKPAILCTAFNSNLMNLHYNIASKLIGTYSESEFIKDPMKKRISSGPLFSDENEFDNFKKKNRVYEVLCQSEEKLFFKKIKDFKYNENCFPIFKSTFGDEYNNEFEGKIKKQMPSINSEKLCVSVGMERLFMLPVWKCFQTNNIIYDGPNKIYDFLFKNYNLRHYLHNIRYDSCPDTLYSPIEEDELLNIICLRKIYNNFGPNTIKFMVGKCTDPELINKLFTDKLEHKYMLDQTPKYDEKSKIYDSVSAIEIDGFDMDDFLIDEPYDSIIGDQIDDDLVTMLKRLDFGAEMGDSFLISPKRKPWKRKTNYVLSRLKQLPSVQFTINRKILLKQEKMYHMSFPDFLNNCIKNFNLYYETGNSKHLYSIHELLCCTTLKSKLNNDKFKYYSTDTEFQFYVNRRYINPEQQFLEKVKNSKNIMNYNYVEGILSFSLLVDIKKFHEEYNKSINTKYKDFLKEIHLFVTKFNDDTSDYL